MSMGKAAKLVLLSMLAKLCKLEEVSYENAGFFCAHVSRLESLVFPRGRRHVYGKKLQKLLPFEGFSSRLVMSFLRGKRGAL